MAAAHRVRPPFLSASRGLPTKKATSLLLPRSPLRARHVRLHRPTSRQSHGERPGKGPEHGASHRPGQRRHLLRHAAIESRIGHQRRQRQAAEKTDPHPADRSHRGAGHAAEVVPEEVAEQRGVLH